MRLATFVALGAAASVLALALVARDGGLAVRSELPSVDVVVTSGLAAPTTSAAATADPTSTTGAPLDRPLRVAFFGDSLGTETTPHLAALLHARQAEYRYDGFPGTATCDYLDEMRRTAVEFDPDVVVLLFTGNALTPCMTDRTGGARGILEGDRTIDLESYAVAYAADTAAAIDAFAPDVDVVIVGPPETRPGRQPAGLVLDDIYRRAAEMRSNVDYLATVELLTPGGVYADELPCTFVEPCAVGEPVQVRHDDGAHLCPERGFCYGGLRMALAIADAVDAATSGARAR